MTDLKPMPRAAIFTAGWIIALAAVAGFSFGLVRDLKGAGGVGGDADLGAAVAPIRAANAEPLVAPPVTEADVRRWAREEMLAANARAAKKKSDDDATLEAGDTAAPPPPPIVPGQPLSGNVTTPKPTPAQPAPQIPF